MKTIVCLNTQVIHLARLIAVMTVQAGTNDQALLSGLMPWACILIKYRVGEVVLEAKKKKRCGDSAHINLSWLTLWYLPKMQI